MDEEIIIEEKINKEEKEEKEDLIVKYSKRYQNKPYISITLNNKDKSYFIVLDKNNDEPIKYIYNINDNILEKNNYETLIISKDNIRDQMAKQKNLNPNNFYVFIQTQGKKLQGEKIETPIFIREKKLKIDYGYYISNQIMLNQVY